MEANCPSGGHAPIACQPPIGAPVGPAFSTSGWRGILNKRLAAGHSQPMVQWLPLRMPGRLALRECRADWRSDWLLTSNRGARRGGILRNLNKGAGIAHEGAQGTRVTSLPFNGSVAQLVRARTAELGVVGSSPATFLGDATAGRNSRQAIGRRSGNPNAAQAPVGPIAC